MAHDVLACLTRFGTPWPASAGGRLHRGAGTGVNEYAYSGALCPLRRSMEYMLWSDPRDEPPKEMRATVAMLRRLCWLLPAAVVTSLLLVSVR